MTSKRRHRRVRAKSVTVELETDAGLATYPVENISMGGLFIRTNEKFAVGSHLGFTLNKTGLKRGLKLIAVIANVRRANGSSSPAGIGVRFRELSPSDREKLQQLLQELGLANPEGPDVADVAPISDWGAAADNPFDSPSVTPRMSPSDNPFALPPELDREPPTQPNAKLPKKLAARSSPGLSTLFDDFKPPPEEGSEPISFDSAHHGFRPPPKPSPVAQPEEPVALPAPPTSAAPSPAPQPAPVNLDPQERLMLQIRGLLLQLGEAQERLAAREAEIASLKEEVQRLNGELERARDR